MQMRVLAFVLAGGKGTRLYPLTKERAKPAVPFGGRYRIVDFVLSNLVNSGIYSIYVLVQFKSQSLLQHLREGWEAGGLLRNNFIIPVPAQMRSPGEDWYRGTADAIFQNINLIEQAEPHLVVIFGADHIYRMNIREMIEYHVEKRAQVTVSAIPVEKEQSSEFGVVETRDDGSINGFHEKNPDAPTMPGDPSRVYASMGNYIFSTKTLLDELYADAKNENSSHDFGRDILPSLIGRADMYAYDFQTNRIPGDVQGAPVYWRDVGTLDAYFDASMDLRAVTPILNLYNRQWPLRTAGYSDPPAKFIFSQSGWYAVPCSAAVFACIRELTSKTRSSSITATSAETRRYGGQFSIRTFESPRAKQLVTTWNAIGSVITSPKAVSSSWKAIAPRSTSRRWSYKSYCFSLEGGTKPFIRIYVTMLP
jgi:glucose-1-phosphate adenylyltransferase